MNYSRLVYDGVSGGIIGYFTNWLAIKMLFRPYNEKRIFGVKVPFTPGLIPKEINRIALSVGETIGGYILDEETILKELQSMNITQKIDSVIENKIASYIDKESTISQILKDFYGAEYDTMISATKEGLLKLLYSIEIDYDTLAKDIIQKAIASQKELKTVVPSEADLFINNQIQKSVPKIIARGKEILSSEIVELKIKQAVKNYMSAKSGLFGLLGGFINVDSIYEALKPELLKALDEEEIKEALLKELLSAKDKVMDKNLGEIIYEEPEELINKLSLHMGEKIKAIVTEGNGKEFISQKLGEALDKLLDTKLEYIVTGKHYSGYLKLKGYLLKGINDLVNANAKKIVNSIDIQRIVRERIGSFELSTTEKLIIDIAGKELKAINYLEGFLGLIMGVAGSILAVMLKM